MAKKATTPTKIEKVALTYKGRTYDLVFNLNVMEQIQEEYGTVAAWGDLTDNAAEPNAKAVIFGLMCMINEGIDIYNEENADEEPKAFMTRKQVGRMLTEIGLEEAAQKLKDSVINSTKSEEKN